MASPLPVGSDVSAAGTFRCTNCGYEIDTLSIETLPPCPDCQRPDGWEPITEENRDDAHELQADRRR
jgi:lipopolysaccharide biosynthesis regulator YciM